MQQFREIDERLNELVPKVAEINTICKEVYRENVLYEPNITTDVNPDGSKVSRLVVRVYPDKQNLEEYNEITQTQFTDGVYFTVQELYENYEKNNFDVDEETMDREMDGEVFGWSLTDAWHNIGHVYYFLLSVYNLIETSKDESPIIDHKGII